MDDLISRQDAIDALNDEFPIIGKTNAIIVQDYIRRVNNRLHDLPSAQPEVIRCKDCKHQKKVFHEDKRRKDGGYYIFGCELVDGYSPVCFDDEFCSRAERRPDE